MSGLFKKKRGGAESGQILVVKVIINLLREIMSLQVLM
jgi:hypothetical protein